MTIATTPFIYDDDGCIGGTATHVAWLPVCKAVVGLLPTMRQSKMSDRVGQ